MNFVTDTHALFYYLINSPRMGPRASKAFDDADAGLSLIYVPAIVLAELYYLNQKVGQPFDFPTEFLRLSQSGQFVFLSFTPEETLDFDADKAVPEMHDRIIVGAARRLGFPLLTRDVDITNSALVTAVW